MLLTLNVKLNTQTYKPKYENSNSTLKCKIRTISLVILKKISKRRVFSIKSNIGQRLISYFLVG